ncbi:AsmA-like C-terminal region-containing protein [Stieleria sp. JC731]|uniref:AsmA-like C-terminal region-containing protein n=1 Tax=Pirellulaceae TaxID=2691357 RepID=UPI001E4FDFAC|nr:AsmA-like C-terminal region-containing protein [Stieleria sp. JC731]MCC9600051.1 AsmA-like C-terminal region-containing protein [Stieleria sp. JC731]
MRRCFVAACLLLAVVCVLRNSLVRLAAVHGATFVLGTHVEIDSLQIGLDRWTVTGVRIYEPDSVDGGDTKLERKNDLQFGVDQVTIIPSLRRGLRQGVWLELVVVDHPQGHVRFDEAGKLISVFPQSESSSESTEIGTIPVRQVVVNDAEFTVHQVGRKPLQVRQVDVHARCADSVSVSVNIPDLFGGKFIAGCDLNAKDFSGTSYVDLAGVSLSTKAFAELPLIPREINFEPVTAGLGFYLRGQHPPIDSNLLDHQIECDLVFNNIATEHIGEVCSQLKLKSSFEDRQAELRVLANPFGGEFAIVSSVDLKSPEPSAKFDMRLAPFDIGSLAEDLSEKLAGELPELPEATATASAIVQATAKLTDNHVKFAGQTRVIANQLSFNGLDLPSATFESRIHGETSTEDPLDMTGEAEGNLQVARYDIQSVAKSLGLADVTGVTSVEASFGVPLATVTKPETYHADATIRLLSFGALGFSLDDMAIGFGIEDSVAELRSDAFNVRDSANELLAQVSPGLNAKLTEPASLQAELRCFVQPTRDLVAKLGLNDVNPKGRLDVSVQAACPLLQVAETAAWKVDTNLQTKNVSCLGETVSDIDWDVHFANDQLTSTPLNLQWRSATATATLNGTLGKEIEIDGTLNLTDLLLAEVSEVASRFSQSVLPLYGIADVDGYFNVTTDLSTGVSKANAGGAANLHQANYAGTEIGDATLRWELTPEGLTARTESQDFLGGSFQVTADMNELDWTTTKVHGTFSGLDVPTLVAVSGQSIPSTGLLEGGFNVTSLASLESLEGQAWMETRQVSIQQVPLQLDRASVTLSQQQLSAQVDGSVMRGRFTGNVSAHLNQLIEFASSPQMRIAKAPVVGRMKLVGLPLDQIATTFRMPPEARKAGGILSGECIRDASSLDGRHLCKVSGSLEDLRYQGVGLSQLCSLEAVIHQDRVELNSLQGRIADGRINGTGAITFVGIPSGYFDCAVSRVNLRRATSAVGVKDISGSATLRLRSRIGPVITGRADIQLDHLVAAGVGVRQATFPVDWSFRPAGMTARWQCRAGRLSVGGGTVRVASEGRFTRSIDTVTSVQVQRVDLAKLMKHGSVGTGIVDGNIALRAKHARSINDVVGTYNIEMSNIEALEFPILDQLPKMVTLSAPTPGRGQDGAVAYGRIGGGIVHIEEIAVYQSNVQVLVTGKANFNQALDLDVVASTSSDSPTDQLVSLLDSPLMLAAPAPVALIVKANELLKDRVVNVHVGGTASRPVLRLQTGKQLGQNAVKFFLTSSFGSTVTNLSQLKNSQSRR